MNQQRIEQAGELKPAVRELLAGALNYVDHGVPILPVWPIRDGRCSCGDDQCSSPGKHPIEHLVPNGLKDATTDKMTIEKWLSEYPDANIATPDFLCIDVDVRQGGLDHWHDLLFEHGRPNTPQSFTPSGGEHWYFDTPLNWNHSNRTGDLPPGIDVRGHGTGYTLLPPSNHLQGSYEWEASSVLGELEVEDLPAWLAYMLALTQGDELSAGVVTFSKNGTGKVDLSKFNLTELIRSAILRKPGERTNRSAIDQSVIAALVRAGASDDQIKGIFEQYPIGTDGKYADKGAQAERYLSHSISRARRYLSKPSTAKKPYLGDAGGKDLVPAVALNEKLRQVNLEVLKECLHRQELGDGELLTYVYNSRLVYDHSEKKGKGWNIWAGHHWRRDTTAEVKLLLSGQVAAQYLGGAAELNRQASEAQATGQTESAEQMRTFSDAMTSRARDLRKKARTRNAIDYAASLLGVTGEIWDKNPYLLPVSNGVINLKTGELEPGDPKDYVRTFAPVEWCGLDEPSPRFEDFVLEIMGNDDDMAAFLQRLLGYGISGLTDEHILPVLWGDSGRNGKDTLLDSIAHVLGPLASPVTKDTVLDAGGRRSSGSAEPHIHDLKGKRIVWASEPREGSRFDAAQIKLITGGGRLKARQLYGNLVEWVPTHLVLLATNQRPHAPADDEALWSRILLIPLNQRFVSEPHCINEHKADQKLKAKLMNERSGILAWLVRGFLTWQNQGLNPPDLVKNATSEYRQAEDTISQFTVECCVIDSEAQVRASDLFAAYDQWCEELGIRNQMDGRTFGEKMGKRFDRGRTRKGRVYKGIGLLVSEDSVQGV